MGKSKKQPMKHGRSVRPRRVRLYSLEVGLSRSSATERTGVSRLIQIRGDQHLDTLHTAITAAFDRTGDYSYEFQFEAGPLHPEGKRYVLPAEYELDVRGDSPVAGRVTDSSLDSLPLQAGQSFGYWPDSGDDWWHPITVRQVKDAAPGGAYPKITRRTGASPFSRTPARKRAKTGIGTDEGADTACLVGEMHLSKGEHQKAIEAFSRAIEVRATVDAYEGRAKAFRALALLDELAAQKLPR
jgi:hypothetical protein